MYFNDFVVLDMEFWEVGLNPYCNGCTSMIRQNTAELSKVQRGLNPYCNGCTSMISNMIG